MRRLVPIDDEDARTCEELTPKPPDDDDDDDDDSRSRGDARSS
jgi:hypothetical protein